MSSTIPCYICRLDTNPKFKCERCSRPICPKCRGFCDSCKDHSEKDIIEEKEFTIFCRKCIRKFKCDRNTLYSDHVVCESCSRLCKFCRHMTCYDYLDYDCECWFECSKCKKEGCVECLCEDGLPPIPCSNFHSGGEDSRYICKDCSLKNPNPLYFCDSFYCSSQEICQKCIDSLNMPFTAFRPNNSIRFFGAISKEKPIYQCNCEECEVKKTMKRTACHECCIWKYRMYYPRSLPDKRIECKHYFHSPTRIQKETETHLASSDKKKNSLGLSFCKLCEELYCSNCISKHSEVHEKNMSDPFRIVLFGMFHHNYSNRKIAIQLYQKGISLLRSSPNNLREIEEKNNVSIQLAFYSIGLAYEEETNLENVMAVNELALSAFNQCIQEIERKSLSNSLIDFFPGNISIDPSFEDLLKNVFLRKILCLQKLMKFKECTQKAEEFLECISPNSWMRMVVYRVLAACYGYSFKISKSLKYARKSIDCAKENGNRIHEIVNMSMLCDLLFSFTHFKKAAEVSEKALSIIKDLRNQKTFPKRDLSELLTLEKTISETLSKSRSRLKECKRIHERIESGRATHFIQADPEVMTGMYFLNDEDRSKVECDFSKVSKNDMKKMRKSEKKGLGSCRILFNEADRFKKKEEKRKKKRIICKKCKKKESFEVHFKVCSGCRKAYYCSVDCQKKDWKVHKKDCGGKKTTRKV